MHSEHRNSFKFLLVCCGIMLGAGLGAAMGSVALGIFGGVVAGGAAATALHLSWRG
jgi:hypothetical protein